MSLLLTAGKALARKANLVAPATSGTVTATSPAAAAKSAMESIAATLRDMKPQERVAFADMDDKQGLVQLILAHYGHAGIVELASIERDLRNLANQFHFVVEGTAKAELIKGKKNAA
jgi:ABC-type phosphate transport system substrate-binding protein